MLTSSLTTQIVIEMFSIWELTFPAKILLIHCQINNLPNSLCKIRINEENTAWKQQPRNALRFTRLTAPNLLLSLSLSQQAGQQIFRHFTLSGFSVPWKWVIRNGSIPSTIKYNVLMTYLGVKKRKDKGQRSLCGCIASKDIGRYNTCPHLCGYCYANVSDNVVRRSCSLWIELTGIALPCWFGY